MWKSRVPIGAGPSYALFARLTQSLQASALFAFLLFGPTTSCAASFVYQSGKQPQEVSAVFIAAIIELVA